ncbi:hypothetical protein A5742_14600 [Mycolicibacterium fortuitum]|uniref:HTH tetR-type domain-containing protein n=1 Tax=Mycolicibacterium fortuitum TaxID=1766 RepID=A0ABD6QC66_MYCFO|nr:TetR/AcrR family transcriptional regulator [Mycolicibacterium fortuitum]OMC33123.1 hypothetical protein A5742_14600 [Mycolicibacterium fortuitum]
MPRDARPTTPETKKRGRPRVEIDTRAVADAVGALFAEGGLDAVSVPNVAERLAVSRPTLYRTIPTKEDLIALLFEQRTAEIMSATKEIVATHDDPGDCLAALVQFACGAAIEMRYYLPVFFGGGGLPDDVFGRWHDWNRDFEQIWINVVATNIEDGLLPPANPVITARLILGACVWVSRWYREDDPFDATEIVNTAMGMVTRLQEPTPPPKRARGGKKATPSQSTRKR